MTLVRIALGLLGFGFAMLALYEFRLATGTDPGGNSVSNALFIALPAVLLFAAAWRSPETKRWTPLATAALIVAGLVGAGILLLIASVPET